MQKKYTEEQIRKAIEQAIANVQMENIEFDYNKERNLFQKVKTKVKVRKNGFK